MRAFFWLSASVDKRYPNYRVEVLKMAAAIGLQVVFNDDKSASDPREAWVAEQIGAADFCFFDVTDASPDCLIALGMAHGQDAQAFTLRDVDGPTLVSQLVKVDREYLAFDDFQRKAKGIIESITGTAMIQHQVLIEHIKEKIRKLGPLPVRGIANELRRDPDEIRPVVFSMVAGRVLEKVNDKRWARYALRN